MEESEREKLVDGMAQTGMDRARARLAVDLAVKACEEALGAVERAASRAPDPALALATMEIAMQLVSHHARIYVETLHETFKGADIIRGATQVTI